MKNKFSFLIGSSSIFSNLSSYFHLSRNLRGTNMDKFLRSELSDEDIDIDKALWKPYRHLASLPGKGARNIFMGALSFWMPDVPQDVVEEVEKIWQNFHESHLLLDDIQDNSSLRRGAPPAHTIFGIANTVSAVDAMILTGYEKLLRLRGREVVILTQNQDANASFQALRACLKLSIDAVQGQGLELYWTAYTICPSEKDYFLMVSKKTGAGFLVPNELLKLFSKISINTDTVINALGQYFQIRDDYQNLKSEKYFRYKGFGEDITEGKFGFPTVHACNTDPNAGNVLKGILRLHTNDLDLKKWYVDIVERCGSFEYTRVKMNEYKAAIDQEFAKLGKGKAVDDLMALITH